MTAAPHGSPTGHADHVGEEQVPVDGRSWRFRWEREDRAALGIWLASRFAVLVVVAGSAAWFFAPDGEVVPYLDRWQQWDFHHYWGIALWGYADEPTGVPAEAFFPGFPATLWLGDLMGVRHVLMGLLVSVLAGGVAALALRRLGDLEGGPGTGRLAVLLWVLAPPAVFLAAPYTEALFLAAAVPAWLAARRGHWHWAGLLVALSCTVRVNGVFLAAAVAVEFLTSPHRDWRRLPWLALPAVPLGAWTVYLYQLTGTWDAWLTAQARGWGRHFTWPWDAFARTWQAAFGGGQSPNYAWMFRVEIAAVLVGVVLIVALACWRRWGAATWVGLNVVALATSTWYFSVPRSTLLWWPLFITLAMLAARRRWVLWCYLTVSAPLMVVWAVAFLSGEWAG